jgi:hypothetical protein
MTKDAHMNKITNSNIAGAIGARFEVDNNTNTWSIKRSSLFSSTIIYQVAESDIVQFKIIDNKKPFGPAVMSLAYQFRDGNWIVEEYDVSDTMTGRMYRIAIDMLKRRFAHLQESPF